MIDLGQKHFFILYKMIDIDTKSFWKLIHFWNRFESNRNIVLIYTYYWLLYIV